MKLDDFHYIIYLLESSLSLIIMPNFYSLLQYVPLHNRTEKNKLWGLLAKLPSRLLYLLPMMCNKEMDLLYEKI